MGPFEKNTKWQPLSIGLSGGMYLSHLRSDKYWVITGWGQQRQPSAGDDPRGRWAVKGIGAGAWDGHRKDIAMEGLGLQERGNMCP